MPAAGGIDPETMEEIRRDALQAFAAFEEAPAEYLKLWSGEDIAAAAVQILETVDEFRLTDLANIAAVSPEVLGKGRVEVKVYPLDASIMIDVIDNGIGLPAENRQRLLEPYMTTREKGTGLGLAIVGRILEEHGGGIELRDASEKFPGERGAWMRLHFIDEHVTSGANSAEAPEQIQEVKAEEVKA